jgi:hypothetical protein
MEKENNPQAKGEEIENKPHEMYLKELDKEIEDSAHRIYLARKGEPGSQLSDGLQAEKEFYENCKTHNEKPKKDFN